MSKLSRREMEQAETIVVDSYVPNYRRRCIACEAVPVVDAMQGSRQIKVAGLCGPCTFGTARAIDPDAWNALDD